MSVVEDVKGQQPKPGDKARGLKAVGGGPAWSVYRIKAKLFRAIYGFEVEVYPPKPPKQPRRKA